MYKDRRGKFNELDLQTVACHTAVGLTDSFNCKFNNLLIIDQGNKGSPVSPTDKLQQQRQETG